MVLRGIGAAAPTQILHQSHYGASKTRMPGDPDMLGPGEPRQSNPTAESHHLRSLYSLATVNEQILNLRPWGKYRVRFPRASGRKIFII